MTGVFIVLPILLPLAAATLAFLLRRGAVAVSLATALGVAGAVTVVTLEVYGQGPLTYTVGGWEAPLGIELYADGLTAVMLLMAAVVGVAITVYAAGYFSDDSASARFFWPLFLFLWSAMNVIFLSADVFNLYVGLELMGLSAVALLTLEGKRDALTAGMRYLLVSLSGSLIYLLGVALLYGTFGTLDIPELGARMFPGPATWAALGLVTAGMMLKTALFPLHFWLPPAHSSAPSPVSALLSALVIKGSFYLLLRLWFDVFPEALTPAAGQLLGILGAAAILWGSVLALFQRRLKAPGSVLDGSPDRVPLHTLPAGERRSLERRRLPRPLPCFRQGRNVHGRRDAPALFGHRRPRRSGRGLGEVPGLRLRLRPRGHHAHGSTF